VKSWLNNLVRRLGLALLKISCSSQTKGWYRSSSETIATRLIVWTRKEAELAWKAGRTEANLAKILPEDVESTKTVSGRFIVDHIPARVVICVNEEIKRQILGTMRKENAEQAEQQRAASVRRDAMEEEWRKNGCIKDSSGNWVVPEELIWRSLPRGEDR